MSKQVLVVAAHPDDEVLGCGGTIARHCADGDTVSVLILAQGVVSRGVADQQAQLDRLQTAARLANDILGVQRLELDQFPDNEMDSVTLLSITRRIEAAVAAVCPEVVYTHHAGDVNIDHRRIHQAVVTACRPLPGHRVQQLLFFEVASSTEWQPPGSAPAFLPNYFVDISTTLQTKLAALQAYECEMRAFPHARSIEAVRHLACWRGASVGRGAAEAFMLGRQIS